MAQQMLAYIRQEPQVWDSILQNRKEITKSFVELWQNRPLKRMVFIGSGSSNIASRTAKEILERLIPVEAAAIEPTRLHTLIPLLDLDSTLFCAVSQSGKSTSTIWAIEALHKAGASVTAVTAHPDSPIALACDNHVEIACGEELVGPKTKGMTSSSLTLVFMVLELALVKGTLSQTDYDAAMDAFQRSFACAPQNIETCVQWCAEHQELAKAPHMILVADGMNLPPALEGALKILETLYVPVFAYEFEEYLHGVGNTLNQDSWLFLLTDDRENRTRFVNLYDFAAEHGSHNYVVSTGTPANKPNELFLASSGNELTLPYETLLPFQVISALISEEKGINCDKPQFTDFAQRLNTKA